jgi:5-(aminomethyl)-3-furanmethanol phosphate kinase
MRRQIVVKLGGASLFKPKGFQRSLQSVLEQHRDDKVYLIVGGGELVEAMRTLHRIYPDLDHEEMHWRCIELLDYTWSIVCSLVPNAEAIRDASQLEWFRQSETMVGVACVRVRSYYEPSTLPRIPPSWHPSTDWNTTTDALALVLAKIVGAQKLVLIKQGGMQPNLCLAEAARLGIVDTEIARLAIENKDNHSTIVELKGLAITELD